MNIVAFTLRTVRRHGLDVYLTLALGLAAFFVSVFGGSIEHTVSILSGVIALLAFNILRDRDQLYDVPNQLAELMQPESVGFVDFNHEVGVLIGSAQEELWIMSTTLKRVLNNFAVPLEEALARGCNVRVIFCADDDTTLDLLTLRTPDDETRPMIENELMLAAQQLQHLRKRYNGRCHLEVRRIAYVPTTGMYVADPLSTNGRVLAFLMGFRTLTMKSPCVRADKCANLRLYDFFREQYEYYWQFARPLAQANGERATEPYA